MKPPIEFRPGRKPDGQTSRDVPRSAPKRGETAKAGVAGPSTGKGQPDAKAEGTDAPIAGFDRLKYQREYMRLWRARKAGK